MENYSDIGQLLKRAREEYRQSIEQAAQGLHIRHSYLQALESGDLTALPGLTYARGYLQSYAAYLGLDKDEILRRFEAAEHGLTRRGFFLPQVFSRDKTPTPAMVWGGLAVALAAYVFWLAAVRPMRADISPVEPFTLKMEEKPRLSAQTAQDTPCLRRPEAIYPPCTLAPAASYYSILPRGRLNTIMQLK